MAIFAMASLGKFMRGQTPLVEHSLPVMVLRATLGREEPDTMAEKLEAMRGLCDLVVLRHVFRD